ncbi:EAL domain-containing protein [Vibrio sp. JC009]|uniref:sensor domain-containing protein n=1 Tax=Vibrio sp. JC009 TaxID=2912314 RepID=UPI0023AF855B|nr:GGDEF domain-containing phosphodiesterase [Vibrio sp. JC009]WED21228.1 EAL domain-containing protein [Vibrio sp. JC009]
MKGTKHTDNSFKSRLMDVVTGNIELSPSLHSSCVRNGTISDMSADEKYLLFFSIVNQSSNAVVITDDRKRIVYVNKKFEQMSGYSSDEVLGKNPNIQKSGKTPARTYQEMHRNLKAKECWKGELINRHRNGNEYIEEAVISPITNSCGDIICFLSEKKDITTQKEAEKSVRKLMHYDSLTGIPNRAYFLKEVDRLTGMPRIDENRFSVLFIDLNHFKELNDTYGHIAGDKALQKVAERVQQIIPLGDFVARVGGDEYVVVHKNADETSTAQLANKIADSFNSPIVIHDKNNFLGVSIGSAMWPLDGLSIKKILIRADMAMYNSKLNSQSYTAYTDALGRIYGREFKLARKLDQAIQGNNLSLVYQPKVNLQTGKVDGMEALLRWDDPELGFISPAEFIPVAEKYKKMTSIGNWVLKEACRQLHRWKSEQKEFSGRIAVNISVQQIENSNFYENMLSILYGQNISPSMIELEVTESLLISDPDRVMSLFDKLKSAGFSIAIDDFGTGYSSLAYLRKIKADTLKIDKSFIDNITYDSHDRAIVKSIIELGHNLGLSVIAEGVETKAQLKLLKQLGGDEAQGYLFSKPQSASEIFPLKNHRSFISKTLEKRFMAIKPELSLTHIPLQRLSLY